jgi:DNA-directed RNA polymerase specialized sigma24 family protein
MPGQAVQNGAIRVSPMDQRGRAISPPVLIAAEEISRRAICHAERLLIDPAVAANLLEETAAAVSRVLQTKNTNSPVRNLESYLFRAFLRHLNRVKKRQLLIAEAVELQAFLSRMSSDPRRTLEMKILMDELLVQCNPVTRDFICRRFADCSWSQVGQAYGISAHAAESKFSQAIQMVKKRLGLK